MKIENFFNQLEDLNDSNYRFHLAKPSEGWSPSNAIAESRDAWKNWQTYKNRGNGERFPRPVKYIFSFGQIQGNDFIFGGIFEIKDRSKDEYEVEYLEIYQELIGRVILTYSGDSNRGTVFTPSYILSNSRITTLLKSEYKGESFPGVENINHKYNELKLVFDNQLQDWKSVLSNVKGIYLLSDTETGKHYVGSAKGDTGIYGRWSEYIYGFDGGNKELIKLKREKGESYFRENFKFTILETLGIGVSNIVIEKKESFWKDKLLTKQFGYNSN